MVSCIIVDDDNDFTEIFSDFLINSGLKVYSICTDGKKAVDAYVQARRGFCGFDNAKI